MQFFIPVLAFVLLERGYELIIANRNTRRLIARGAVEFGEEHYGHIVVLHAFFFVSLILEAFIRGVRPPPILWPTAASIFLLAQMARVWVIRTMDGRWTTRIIVVPGETLISKGPFHFLPHPNYLIVATEILCFPLIFGLYFTTILFTALNAVLLLGVRIPEERKALALYSGGYSANILK